MGYSIKNNTKIAIMEEVTEGTFVVPASGSNFIQAIADGVSMDPSKELLERDLLGAGLSKETPRTGLWSVSGTISVEAKANGVEGEAPEYGLLLESGLGNKRSAVTKTSSDTDGGTYSDTVICFDLVDVDVYNVGDTLLIKRAGEFHRSPIKSIAGNEVTLLVADPAGAFVDGLEVGALTTYLPADEDHKAVSISKYIEDAVLESAVGCKVKSIAFSGFETGAMAKFDFGFEGLYPDRAVSANALTPSFDTALPPIVLGACLYQDGVAVEVNSFDFSVENELGFITSTCNIKGKTASRVTSRMVSGNFLPYKQNDDVDQWDLFEANSEFSIHAFMYVPSSVDGEGGDYVSVYIPVATTTEIGEGDKDGVLQDTIAWKTGGAGTEIYITFI